MTKILVTLKDPDTVSDARMDAAKASLADLPISDAEKGILVDARADTFRAIASIWFEYSEYLTVEIDTDTQTCRVLTVRETK